MEPTPIKVEIPESASHSPKNSMVGPSKNYVDRSRSKMKMLLVGIEVLAHKEQEREGLEVYVSEGRTARTQCGKIGNIGRWVFFVAMILLNAVDPIISFIYCFWINNSRVAVILLSATAFIFSIIFALSVNVCLASICMIANISIRIVSLVLRCREKYPNGSIAISYIAFGLIALVFTFELVHEYIITKK